MRRALWIGLVVLGALLPLLLDPRGYWIRVLTLTLLFAAMAQAWNIVGGLANQVSLGHAAFFGIGAYTSTILLVTYGLSPWIGLGDRRRARQLRGIGNCRPDHAPARPLFRACYARLRRGHAGCREHLGLADRRPGGHLRSVPPRERVDVLVQDRPAARLHRASGARLDDSAFRGDPPQRAGVPPSCDPRA